MVGLNVFSGPAFGTRVTGGCCNATVEQLISISEISKFPTSGLQMQVKRGYISVIPSRKELTLIVEPWCPQQDFIIIPH